MKKTTAIFLASALLLTNPLSGSATEEKDREKIPITFLASGTGDYAETRKKYLEEMLLEKFPYIEIYVEAYPEEQYYSVLNTRLSMGEGPDFFNIQPYWAGPNAVRKLAEAGYMEPLEDLQAVAVASEEEKVPVMYEGHVYSLSRGGMILCTYYNKDIFEEQELSIPENWPEFLRVCEKLKDNGVIPLVSGNKDMYVQQFGLYQIAACQVYAAEPDYNQKLEDGSAEFTDSGTWDEVLKRYLMLYDNGYVMENSLSMGQAEASRRFAKGEAAMMFGGNFNYSELSEWMGEENLGVFPLPANDEGEPVYGVLSHGGGMAVYAQGEHTELCKEIFQVLYENSGLQSSEMSDETWGVFNELEKKGHYTINCNQGWKGDVEWALEDGISRRIGGEGLSVSDITENMQEAYEQ